MSAAGRPGVLSPTEAVVHAAVAGFRPRAGYAGSIHDAAAVRRHGYRGALVPGVVLYGIMADLAARSWGLDWVARGWMRSRSRRPVYEGDPLTILAGPVREDAAGLVAEMEVRVGEAVVAAGAAGLPRDPPPPPDPADYPVLPVPDPLPAVGPGGFRPGDRFGCTPARLGPEALEEALAALGPPWPGYAAAGVVPPVLHPTLAARHALSSRALATPSIYVSASVQHLGAARVGAEMATSGSVIAVYERGGNHYIDGRHLVLADGRPVALVERTSVYAAREG